MFCYFRGCPAAQTGGMKRSFGAGGKFMAIYKKYLISDIFAWIYQFFLVAFCHSPGAKSLILHPEVCSIHSTDGY